MITITTKNHNASCTHCLFIISLYKVGCIAKIRQILRTSGDIVRVVVEGECRATSINIEDGNSISLRIGNEIGLYRE